MKIYSLYDSSYYFFQSTLEHHNLDFSLSQSRLVREQAYCKNFFIIRNSGKENETFNQFMLEQKKHFQHFDNILSIWASINFMFTYITLLHACRYMIGSILLNVSILVLIGWTLSAFYSTIIENNRLIGDIKQIRGDVQDENVNTAVFLSAVTKAAAHSEALEAQTITVSLYIFMYLMVLFHEWFEVYVISEAVFYPAMFSILGVVYLLYMLMVYDFHAQVELFCTTLDESEAGVNTIWTSSSGNF